MEKKTNKDTQPAETKSEGLVRARNARGQVVILTTAEIVWPDIAKELGFDVPEMLLEKNPHLLMFIGNITEPSPSILEDLFEGKNPNLTPEDIERAMAILLRSIALANHPSLLFGLAPQKKPGILLIEDGRPAVTTTKKPGCKCPCPDGIELEFAIDWDNVGPNINLFKGTKSSGQTQNAKGKNDGESVEVDGSTEYIMDLGNNGLGIVNTADLEVVFNANPFFKNGFDEDKCCLVAIGNFTGVVKVTRVFNRNQANQRVVKGNQKINKTVTIGNCKNKACCTTVYLWDFNKGFNINALGIDVDIDVSGVISATIAVSDK